MRSFLLLSPVAETVDTNRYTNGQQTQPQFQADLHKTWHVGSLYPPDGHGGGFASRIALHLPSANQSQIMDIWLVGCKT